MGSKVIIFDMDGVLIDSEPAYKKMNNILFEKLGIQMNDDSYHQLVGMSSTKMWSMLKEKYNLSHEVRDLIVLEKDGMFEILNSGHIDEPVKGIKALLETLREKNYKLAVASSSAKENILLILERIDLLKYFDFVVSGEEVEHGKPSPDIFLKVAEIFETDPENCYVIEDSSNGVKAAVAAGMKCIGFENVNSGKQDLTGANLKVRNFENENLNLILNFIG